MNVGERWVHYMRFVTITKLTAKTVWFSVDDAEPIHMSRSRFLAEAINVADELAANK